MRHACIAAIVLATALSGGCSSEPSKEGPSSATAAQATGLSGAQDFTQLEKYNGQVVSLTGTFYHDRAIHGILQLDSGLRVYIPHFDLLRRGDDWFKYVGKRCSAVGVLHTYTRNIDGYRGPHLEISDFTPVD